MSSLAKKLLQTTTYSGERCCWIFERYVCIHIDQHTILKGLVQYGYSGIDARSKVQYLLDGIKTTTLDNVKTRIVSDAALQSAFNLCVNLFQDFLQQTSSADICNSNISEFYLGGRKQGFREASLQVGDSSGGLQSSNYGQSLHA